MTVSALVFFVSTLFNFALPANGLVYRTNDAIIIEDSNLYQPMNPFVMVRGTEFMDNLYGAIPVHSLTGLMIGPPSVYPWFIHNNKPPATAGNVKPTDSSNQTTVTCGAGPMEMLSYEEQRVAGAVDADQNSWPSIVRLRLRGIFLCGGSLITRHHILTAARCVDRLSESDLKHLSAHLGMHISSPSDAQQTRTVRRVTIHGRWNPSTSTNDIAVLTLSSPVRFTSAISPVCLPNSHSDFDGFEGTTIGWDSNSNVLQQGTVLTLTNAQCKEINAEMTQNLMCAVSPGKYSFKGERGGPFVIRSSSPTTPQWTQIGIFSFGAGFHDSDYLGVYTRVMSFRNWIKEHANV